MTLDEKQLIQQAQDGDADAFSELARQWIPRMQAWAARSCNSEHDRADIIQEALIDVYKNIEKFDPQRSFGPWIYTILRHRVYKHLRQHHRYLTSEDLDIFLPEKMREPDDARLHALKQCMHEMPEKNRQLIQLRYNDNIPIKDIAEQLGKRPNTLSMLLLRIRQGLQTCIDGKTLES